VNQRVRSVIRKELREFRRNKFVVGTMIALPVVLLVIPIGNILSIKEGTALGAVKAIVGGATLTFFVVPLMLPTVIAGYAVIGEREQGTLEPMLTTPLREEELLLGKAFAAVVPSVIIAYLFFAAYAITVKAAAAPEVVDLVWQPSQVVAIVLFAPLLATFSIWVGLAISVRSNDVRVAQQLSALATLPMLGLIALFTFRVISPTVTVAVIGAAILVVIDAAAWRLVSAMFDRERLITRYGRS
jgi:ABC-2 type transport system permease protein